MAPDVVIAKLRAARQLRVELAPGKAVLALRPPEEEFLSFAGWVRGDALTARLILPYVVGWEGITEADLLGEAVGSSSEIPFSADVCAEVLADKVAWLGKVAEAIGRAIASHRTSIEELKGN